MKEIKYYFMIPLLLLLLLLADVAVVSGFFTVTYFAIQMTAVLTRWILLIRMLLFLMNIFMIPMDVNLSF